MKFDIIDIGPGPFYKYELIKTTDSGSIIQSITIGDRNDLLAFRNMINDTLDRIGGL